MDQPHFFRGDSIWAPQGEMIFWLRERERPILDAEGEEVHMFWDIDQEPVRNVLNGIRVFGLEEIRTWSFRGPVGTEPDRIELRVYERAIALEVLDDLVETEEYTLSQLNRWSGAMNAGLLS